VLEAAMAAPGGRTHPGLLHFYIHLMEMSPTPEAAREAADALRGLVPDAGHLVHMPTHIDVLLGDYQQVIADNEAAIAVYAADLGQDSTLPRACQHPNNVWSLHGYHECLGRLGRAHEAAQIKAQLDRALAAADVEIRSSCFCRE
jgi:hypothetical protein